MGDIFSIKTRILALKIRYISVFRCNVRKVEDSVARLLRAPPITAKS